MRMFEFNVYDEGDLWGSMRIKAPSERAARKVVRKQLLENEVEPNGLLTALSR